MLLKEFFKAEDKYILEDAVLELPFALPNSPSHFYGIDKIRERFGDNSQLHAVNKLFEYIKWLRLYIRALTLS